jgi:hypothetical protein
MRPTDYLRRLGINIGPSPTRFSDVIALYRSGQVFMGGSWRAVRIDCADGSHILITTLDGMHIPDDTDDRLLVGRQNPAGESVDLTPQLRVNASGCREVEVDELQRIINAILDDARRTSP